MPVLETWPENRGHVVEVVAESPDDAVLLVCNCGWSYFADGDHPTTEFDVQHLRADYVPRIPYATRP